MSSQSPTLAAITARIRAATPAGAPAPVLLAVSKTKPADAVLALAAQGQRDFGENYVQEALEKMRQSSEAALSWHLIGPLQSNKCREVAAHFDWLQSLDRIKLVEPLARYRPADKAPLNVLIQVNIDGEAAKSGAAPGQIAALAAAVAARPRLKLRGLMSIGAPYPDLARRGESFARMRALFDALKRDYPDIDTLSMGMSEDFELAIAHGATLVRVGSALFGAR